MQAKLCVVLLAIGLSQIVALPSPSLQINHPSTNFLQYLIQSRDLANGNGDHSIDCLGYYIPLINEGVTVYENNFKACLEQAALEISQINDSTKDDRDAIDASALSSCDALKVCSEKEAAEDYFECYSEAGSNSTKSMFAISANASELLAFVKEEVRLIQVNEYVCTNKTQRVYAENSAKLYEELTLCIGGAPIPSEVASTKPTTAEPESSTDSSSAVPESSTDSSSAEPESSTDSSSAVPEFSTDSSTEPESSTDSTSNEPESSTSSEGDKEAAPEEDLKSLSSHNNKDIQNILKNLQNWFKSH
ncbi:uncharacterized protein LOC128253873 [Drosophila gunungcola]|uniref:uncharacterized protein LOC128253873 n=1 Tax=Drosophila gunungcola TaxID=103775 RepID=UPI0022DF099E|nr:uncharacterized protein LOC128253873 [Drosophila gunungcola]